MSNYEMTPEAYQQMEFETRDFATTCRWCGFVEIAPEKSLLEAGWLLTTHAEVCPKCIKGMERYVGKSETNSGRMVSDAGQAQKAV